MPAPPTNIFPISTCVSPLMSAQSFKEYINYAFRILPNKSSKHSLHCPPAFQSHPFLRHYPIKGIPPNNKTYVTTTSDHISQVSLYPTQPPTITFTTSGAMYSGVPTCNTQGQKFKGHDTKGHGHMGSMQKFLRKFGMPKLKSEKF